MIVGLDAFSLHPLKLTARQAMAWASAHGFAGIQLGHVGSLGVGLEPVGLQALHAAGRAAGLRVEVSVSSPNLHCHTLSATALGERLTGEIAVAASAGWRELHTALGGPRERWDLSVSWDRQLADTSALLRDLAPVLRQHRCRLNLENHGETTTFELVRLVQAIGPEVLGVCLDTANVMVFAEDPVAAAERVAPFVHLTHTKDAIYYFHDGGLMRQGRPPGQGCLDWERILPILGAAQPDLMLAIEDHKWLFSADIFKPAWLAAQADLSRAELARVMALAWQCQSRINRGEWPAPEVYEAVPYAEEMAARLASGQEYLTGMLNRLGLAA